MGNTISRCEYSNMFLRENFRLKKGYNDERRENAFPPPPPYPLDESICPSGDVESFLCVQNS